VKVEHDDAVRVARRAGMSLRAVMTEAERAWHRRGEEPLADVPYIHGPEHAHDHDHGGRHSLDSHGRERHPHDGDATVHPMHDGDEDEPDDAS
jgi:hypothetical protein